MRKVDYIFRIILNVFRFLALKLIYRFRIKCGWKLLVSLRADIYINNATIPISKYRRKQLKARLIEVLGDKLC